MTSGLNIAIKWENDLIAFITNCIVFTGTIVRRYCSDQVVASDICNSTVWGDKAIETICLCNSDKCNDNPKTKLPTNDTASVNDPGHTTSANDPGHNTSAYDPGHNTSANDPGHTTSAYDHGHTTTSVNDPGHTTSVNNPGHTASVNDTGFDLRPTFMMTMLSVLFEITRMKYFYH